MKSTKRALVLSTLSILMCLAMLIGTTYAWFTDTASTAVNTIQSGTLDVDLVDAQGASLVGQTLKFKKAADAPADEAVLWEPGCTYVLDDVFVANKGNLALKYQIVVSGIEGDAKLLEAIEFTVKLGDADLAEGYLLPGEKTAALTISGHMDEAAGNEYQNLTIEGVAITVYATQYTYEYDSIDNQYDKDAEYDMPVWDGSTDPEGLAANTDDTAKTVSIATAEQLAAFAAEVNNGKTYAGYTVTLTEDINLKGAVWTPIGNLVSYPSDTFAGTFDGNGKTISNMNAVDTTPNYATAGLFGSTMGTVKNVTLENVTVVSSHYAGAVVGYSSSSASKVENCTVKGGTVTSAPELIDGSYDNGDKVGGIFGYNGEGAPITGCTIEDVVITAYRDLGGIAGASSGTLSGNTVKNVTVVQDNTNGYKTSVDTYGEIVGRDLGGATLTGNVTENVTVTTK